ncbi:MAG: LysM peptidoglycan-binding domain-containing protein [Bacteroidia bacterium]
MSVIILLASLLVFTSASDKPKTDTPKYTVQQYIEMYSAVAVQEMLRSRIPASIKLAQGVLESGNGNSRLAREANNHFGIKCKSTWTGPVMYEDDDAPQECFRKYESAIDSYRDHSDFLMKNVRYAFLFDLPPNDYKGWAYGLKKAGYATNPQYAELLITFIEKHKLYEYDKIKLSDEEKQELAEEKSEVKRSYGSEFTINGVKAIRALPNESFTKIAIDYDLKINELYRYNDLNKDAVCKEGDTVFIEPKKNRGDKETHVVAPNETMYMISQRNAVKLEKLLERNLMKAGEEPEAGELIYLKHKRQTAPKLANASNYTVVLVEPKINEKNEQVALKIDTQYNKKVYDDVKVNIETQKPQLHPTGVNEDIHEFKENLSFFHTVQKGETLYRIGKKYGVTVASIKYLNLLQSDSIEIGQRLIINPAITDVDTKEPQTIPGVHVVRQGETLNIISDLYKITVDDLKATNNLQSDTIYIGQQLVIVIPVKSEKTIHKNDIQNDEPVYYMVQKGDTLFGISRKFNTTVNIIKELNFPLNEILQEGQKIRVR